MDNKEKIYLMLEEYRALRAEEMERTRFQHQLYAVALFTGMALATAGVFAHRPGLFIFLIVVTAILAAMPIALMHYELHGVGARLREIEYQVNTRSADRIFARESERRPFSLHSDFADNEALRRNWERLRTDSRIYAERWRDGVRHFRETVRARANRHRPYQ
jgi:hypothetical protein